MLPVCPRCDLALVIMEFHEVEVDYCPRCYGLWMDAGELEDLIARSGATVDDPLMDFRTDPPTAKSRRDLCPRCDRRMHIVEKVCADGAHLQLDCCPAGHGLWFDAEELQRLISSYPPECGTGSTLDYLRDVLGTKPIT